MDGPFSLFASSQRYGLKLATFFPSILALPQFNLIAHISDRSGRLTTLELDESAGLVAQATTHDAVRPEVAQFAKSFAALHSEYSVAQADVLLTLPGERVSVPDLSFTHRPSGESIHLEWFGHYSRASVFARVDLIKRGMSQRMLLVVPRDLRVSEELLEDGEAGMVIVYKSTLSARHVLTKLDELRARPLEP